MSDVDVEVVLRTARLAGLEPGDEEARRMAPQFGRILRAFERLRRLDLAGVEPLVAPLEQADVLREDLPRDGLAREDLLARAPRHADGLLRVPPAIGERS